VTDTQILDWLEENMRPGVRLVPPSGVKYWCIAGGYRDGVKLREAVVVAVTGIARRERDTSSRW